MHDFGERIGEFGEFPTVDLCLIRFSGEARDYYFHSRLIAPIIDEQSDPLFRTLRIPVDFQDVGETVKGWRRRGRENKLSAVLYVLSVPTWPVNVGERIYAFRRAYEPARAAIVPAHVTLVFGARAISQDELTAHVAEVARRTAPFRVSFSAAEIHEDSISGGYKLFLLTNDGTHTLSTLHRALYVGGLRSELRTDICYRPHMTIATADSAEGIQMALANVPSLGLPLSGTVENLRVCATRQHGIETIATLALAA